MTRSPDLRSTSSGQLVPLCAYDSGSALLRKIWGVLTVLTAVK